MLNGNSDLSGTITNVVLVFLNVVASTTILVLVKKFFFQLKTHNEKVLMMRRITDRLNMLPTFNKALLSLNTPESISSLTEEMDTLLKDMRLQIENEKDFNFSTFEEFDNRLHNLIDKMSKQIEECYEERVTEMITEAKKVREIQPDNDNGFVRQAALLLGFSKESPAKQPPLPHQLGNQNKSCQKGKRVAVG